MIINESTSHNSIFSKSIKSDVQEDTNSNFDALLSKPATKEEEQDISNDPRYVQEKSNQEIIDNMKKLFEDIKSVYETGLTVDELKQLEKMLERIKEEMNKEPMDKKKVRELLDELEKEIARVQKEVKGEAIVEAQDANDKNSSNATSNIENRLEEAQNDIKELKENVAVNNTVTHNYQSTELLQEIKKFQGK